MCKDDDNNDECYFWFFFMMNARCKSVFVFSDLIIVENGKVVKVVGKVFLMIKNGPGFMVSQMHSLFIKWQTMEHTQS